MAHIRRGLDRVIEGDRGTGRIECLGVWGF